MNESTPNMVEENPNAVVKPKLRKSTPSDRKHRKIPIASNNHPTLLNNHNVKIDFP